jgi:glycine C-acetyltransferase
MPGRENVVGEYEVLQNRLTELGFEIPADEHPIVPVIFENARRAARFAERLLSQSVYAVGFSYPVVKG